MTTLPIVKTQDGDVSTYILTNVISIINREIFLSTDIFNGGIAIDVVIFVSVVGSATQNKVMKQVARQSKLKLYQFVELTAFVHFTCDLDRAT
eukprot:Gb_06910 [translate_table: standard]